MQEHEHAATFTEEINITTTFMVLKQCSHPDMPVKHHGQRHGNIK